MSTISFEASETTDNILESIDPIYRDTAINYAIQLLTKTPLCKTFLFEKKLEESSDNKNNKSSDPIGDEIDEDLKALESELDEESREDNQVKSSKKEVQEAPAPKKRGKISGDFQFDSTY